MIIANRIPKDYVVVSGAGQSDFGPGVDPWETAAYDLALLEAGIENCNIVKYTSVMPKGAMQITMDQANEQGLFQHGMVLETIMAQVNGNHSESICAGVGRCKVYKDGEEIGGFAAEYEGNNSESYAATKLYEALQGIFERRYAGKPEYTIDDIQMTTKFLTVDQDYGTVFVAIGFLTFDLPVLD